MLELGSKIQSQVQSEVGKNQREYFLREQMKAIQKELGEGDDQTKEIEELREKIEAAGMPEAVKKEALRELDRLSKMPVGGGRVHRLAHLSRLAGGAAVEQADRRSHRSAEDQAGARRGPLRPREGEGSHPRIPGGPQAEPGRQGADPLLRRPSRRRQDVAGALDRASRSAASSCACRSAACATRRRSAATAGPTSARCPARSSRGCAAPSRRTRCSSSTRSTSSAPISAATLVGAARGAGSGAEQHVPRPLSRRAVRSLRGAVHHHRERRSIRCRPPLRDRMEVLEIAGYTEEEKLKIATDHLVDKQVKNHGLTPEYIQFTPDALRQVIRGYTREAGVRNLEREIGALCRKVARRRAEGNEIADRDHAGRRRRDARRAEVPRRGDGGAHQGSGRRDRPGVDAGRRRSAVHRGVEDGRQRLADADRPARRRDEGVGAGRAVVAARARQGVRHRSGLLHQGRDARARAVGRDPEGWSVGRRDDGDGDGVGS